MINLKKIIEKEKKKRKKYLHFVFVDNGHKQNVYKSKMFNPNRRKKFH